MRRTRARTRRRRCSGSAACSGSWQRPGRRGDGELRSAGYGNGAGARARTRTSTLARASLSLSTLRETRMTFAPRAASFCAADSPRPSDAPVRRIVCEGVISPSFWSTGRWAKEMAAGQKTNLALNRHLVPAEEAHCRSCSDGDRDGCDEQGRGAPGQFHEARRIAEVDDAALEGLGGRWLRWGFEQSSSV